MTEIPTTIKYAGFGIRLGAYIIDSILINLFTGLTYFIIMIKAWYSDDPDTVIFIQYRVLIPPVMISFGIVVPLLYFSILESSKAQGTIGKIVLKIKVTGTKAERISFVRAMGRHFGKVISMAILGIGFLMILSDARKRALHDKICSTFVVYK